MPVNVNIPPALREYTRSQSEVVVNASTVGELLGAIDGRFPGLRAFLINDQNKLRRYVNIFVNETDIRLGEGLMTRLKDGDHVYIIPAIAGG